MAKLPKNIFAQHVTIYGGAPCIEIEEIAPEQLETTMKNLILRVVFSDAEKCCPGDIPRRERVQRNKINFRLEEGA